MSMWHAAQMTIRVSKNNKSIFTVYLFYEDTSFELSQWCPLRGVPLCTILHSLIRITAAFVMIVMNYTDFNFFVDGLFCAVDFLHQRMY